MNYRILNLLLIKIKLFLLINNNFFFIFFKLAFFLNKAYNQIKN